MVRVCPTFNKDKNMNTDPQLAVKLKKLRADLCGETKNDLSASTTTIKGENKQAVKTYGEKIITSIVNY
jgi:hypothetical protein